MRGMQQSACSWHDHGLELARNFYELFRGLLCPFRAWRNITLEEMHLLNYAKASTNTATPHL